MNIEIMLLLHDVNYELFASYSFDKIESFSIWKKHWCCRLKIQIPGTFMLKSRNHYSNQLSDEMLQHIIVIMSAHDQGRRSWGSGGP